VIRDQQKARLGQIFEPERVHPVKYSGHQIPEEPEDSLAKLLTQRCRHSKKWRVGSSQTAA
jgi:hypothetical protein